jgi:hypothetical protein
MTDILFHVSTEKGARILAGLARACARANVRYACFFTHEGVRALGDPALAQALAGAVRAAACEKSWQSFFPGRACPVEPGSQTVNSELVGAARRVVSF